MAATTEIHPNELLGDQRASLELVQSGAIQMAVVLANPLSKTLIKTSLFWPCRTFTTTRITSAKCLPLACSITCLASIKGTGFEVITAYMARSVYTKGAAVTRPADMQGKKDPRDAIRHDDRT